MKWNQKTALSVCAIAICTAILVLSTTVDANFGTSGSQIVSFQGHDIAGTTTNRPGNMSVGMTYFNTTTSRMEVANGASMNNITDVPDSVTAGVVGNPNGLIAGAGAGGSSTTAGAAGGALTVKSGAGGAKTDTGHAAGGTAGSLAVTGANGGNTASNGTDAGGIGATVTVTSGTGGNATAGTGNGGDAGSINLVLGTGGTSAGGTAGADGLLKVNGTVGIEPISFNYSAPDDQPFFVANRPYRVVAITVRPLVVGSDMSAVTATINKAASGTAIASGTLLHTGTIDLKGTVHTNQTLTLSSTSTDLNIATGTAIGIDVTGTTTAARGVVTVLLSPR